MKPGYKQTEIGVIPEDWEVDTIGSVCTAVAIGGNYQNSTVPSDYPLIKMGNLSRGNITLEKVEYIKATVPDKKDLLHYGDVLFNTRNTPELVGKVAIWRDELPEAYYNSNLLRFVFDPEKADPFYMNLALNTKNTISSFRNIAKGTTSVSAIYPQDLLKVLIPIPPLAEQQRIAEALSDVDELIASLEKLIEKKKAIKQGAMQELLTGKRRLPGFSGEWRVATWKEVLDGFISGATPFRGKSEYYKGEIKWVSSGELKYNHITDTIEHISIKALKESNLKIHPSGTFLMAITGLEAAGTRGSCAILDVPATTNQSCMAIYSTEKMSTLFLYYYYLRNGNELAFQYCQGTKQQSYTAAIVKELPIWYPIDIQEQNAIAVQLADIDCEVSILEQKAAKARQIKQGMMQQLLTGAVGLI